MFLYYNKSSGKVLGVSNKQKDTEHGVLEINNAYLSKFDTKNLQKYKVYFNDKLGAYDITEKVTQVNYIDIANKVHILEENPSADVLVVVNRKNKTLSCKPNTGFKEKVEKNPDDYPMTAVIIYLIQKNNPNVILDTVSFNLINLLNDSCANIDISTIHCDFMVTKVFDSYGVVYE